MVHCTSGAGWRPRVPAHCIWILVSCPEESSAWMQTLGFCVWWVWCRGDGEMVWWGRTLPTPGLLGTSQTQTDSIWQLLGESWVRGSWGEQSQQWYTDTAWGEFPCFREGRAQASVMFCDRICTAWDRVTSTPNQWDNWDTEKAVTEGSRWEADTGMRKQYYYLHWDADVTSSDPEFYTGNVIYGLISTPAMLSTNR